MTLMISDPEAPLDVALISYFSDILAQLKTRTKASILKMS